MNRKRSREIAMELLFGMTLSKNTLEETIETFLEDYEMKLNTIDLDYIKKVLLKVEENRENIDKKIEDCSVSHISDIKVLETYVGGKRVF